MFGDSDADSFDFEPPPELKEWLDHQKAKGIDRHVFEEWGQHYIFENGKIRKATMFEAAMCWSDIDARRVDFTTVGDVDISTVFLPLNHNVFAMFSQEEGIDKRPHLFETMIFGGDHDGYCDRYATLGEAKSGHWKAVDLVKGNGNGNESNSTD